MPCPSHLQALSFEALNPYHFNSGILQTLCYLTVDEIVGFPNANEASSQSSLYDCVGTGR